MKKIGNIVLLALLVIAALSVVLWLVRGNDLQEVDLMLYVAYAYLAIAVIGLVVMTAMNMGKSRSNSKIGLYVFGGMAVLAVIFYFVFASAAPVTGADGTVFDNVFKLKMTDMMLYLAYAGLGITVIVLLWGTIRKALK